MFNLSFYSKSIQKYMPNILKLKWYRVKQDSEGWPILELNFDVLDIVDPSKRLQRAFESKYELAAVITLCEALKAPKVIYPSYENCIALENVEIKIDYTDLHMPFPAFFVELPHKLYDRFPKEGN